MIRPVILLFSLSFLYSGNVFCKTEVRPPEGPFQSLLRATYQNVKIESNQVDGGKQVNKTYEFKVPDLGRYQEGAVFEDNLTSKQNSIENEMVSSPSQIDQTPADLQSQHFITFDELPVQGLSDITPANEELTLPLNPQYPNTSFDTMPIGQVDSQEATSYPPEWASSNDFGLNNTQPNTTHPNHLINQGFPLPFMSNTYNGSNNSMMGMPLPNQMLGWPMNNNTNNGYR